MNPQDARDLSEALKLIGDLIASRPNEWLPVYAAIGGAFIGAIATFVPNLIVESFKTRKEGRQIEASMVSEIIALVEIIEMRQYLEGMQAIVEEFNLDPEMTTYSYSVDVPPHYSRIYQENCSRIGLIRSDIAVKIVRFHQLIDALVQDIKPGGVIAIGAGKNSFVNAINIFKKALAIGEGLKSAHNKRLQFDAAKPRD